MFGLFQKKSQAKRVAPFVEFYFSERAHLKKSKKAYRDAHRKLDRAASRQYRNALIALEEKEREYRMAVVRFEEARVALLFAEEECKEVTLNLCRICTLERQRRRRSRFTLKTMRRMRRARTWCSGFL
jgi:hypothetical protein